MKTTRTFMLLALLVFPIMVMGQAAGGYVRPKPKSKPTTQSVPKKTNAVTHQVKQKQNTVVRPTQSQQVKTAGYNVTFSSNVPSATLYIDGKVTGTACVTRYLLEGNHTIKLEAKGYKVFTQNIYVGSNSESFSFVMEKEESVKRANNISEFPTRQENATIVRSENGIRRYSLVVSSFTLLATANSMADNLEKETGKRASVVKSRNGYYRVIAFSSDNLQDVVWERNKLQKKYFGTWIGCFSLD